MAKKKNHKKNNIKKQKNNIKNNTNKQKNNKKPNIPKPDYHIISEFTESDFTSANEFIFEQTESFKFWRWGLVIALPLLAFITLMIGIVLKLSTPYMIASSVALFASVIIAFCAKPLILLFFNAIHKKNYSEKGTAEYKFFDEFMTAKVDGKTTTIRYNNLRSPLRESYSYIFFEDIKNDFVGFLPKKSFEYLAQADEVKEYVETRINVKEDKKNE